MTNETQDMPGIIFFSVTKEDFARIAKLRLSCVLSGIHCLWVKQEWHGKMVDALEVYANANVVAQHLKAMDK